ncbi:hypothetical protein BLX24_26465 [Arsenicibacter rosenii]|uniref:Uncharacterized protein n=1 Tax=Arsenicibacter rosenii TaxID=1750698 RepID=A0A1S2VDY0_9BACT|nr:hypothetical protein BLX24_26465 [Arsenicibacter rosenii]
MYMKQIHGFEEKSPCTYQGINAWYMEAKNHTITRHQLTICMAVFTNSPFRYQRRTRVHKSLDYFSGNATGVKNF